MDVILIHGAPGVGKFTVAKELSKITDYKLIHIHDVYDFLENIFSKDNYEVSLKILNNVYLDVLEEAAKLKLNGIIFTYAEIARNNFAFIKQLKQILDRYNCKLKFIHITCDKQELKKRVTNSSRKRFKKTHTLKELEFLLSTKDYQSKFPNSETFTIDNTNLSPRKTAHIIKIHCKND